MPSQFHVGGGWIRRTTRLAVYLRDGFRCCWCDRSLVSAHPRNVTLDHLKPRERGGSNAPRNLVTACKPCNADRGPLPVATYARTLPDPEAVLARIQRQRRRPLETERAREILADPEQDPRPVVRRARAAGRILAPASSAAGLRRTAVTRQSVAAAPPSSDPTPADDDWYGF